MDDLNTDFSLFKMKVYLDLHIRRMGIPPIYHGALLTTPRPYQGVAYYKAKTFIEHFGKEGFRSSYIMEGVGRVGKSRLACAMMIDLFKKQKIESGWFINCMTLSIALAKSDYKPELGLYKKTGLLILDDLYKFEFYWSGILYDIIEYRLTHNKGIILTSDKPLIDLVESQPDKYKDDVTRIMNRLREMTDGKTTVIIEDLKNKEGKSV